MNNTKYEDDALLEVDYDESAKEDGSFMSECIPEEDGDLSFIDDGDDSAAAQDSTQESDSTTLAGENAALLKRVEDLTSAYLTLAADFENYKKRSQKHMEEVKKFAGEPIMIDMIEVADNLERAIASAEKETADKESLMEGVKNTYRQFMTLLGKHGLSRIPSEPGTEFDPHLHESVAQVPTADYPDETIMNVFKSGYTLNAKVIRPATVTVSTYPEDD